jgi:hypothetical protein
VAKQQAPHALQRNLLPVLGHLLSTSSDENRTKTDGKTLFLLTFLYFFMKIGSGLENTGLETESGYANARKRTNTDGEPEN